ncbi:MAG: RND transporter [Bacteroidota bacterium]
MQKNRLWLITATVIIVAGGLYWWFRVKEAPVSEIVVPVKFGDFEISINAAGELEPKNSTVIQGPTSLNSIDIYQIKISTLVPEGTVVKAGDEVATLDPTEVLTKLRERETDYAGQMALFTQTRLDTSLTLRQARDEMVNMRFTVREKEINLEQSRFEPPATIRQAEMEVDKNKRALAQAQENYLIKQKQAAAKMEEVASKLKAVQQRMQAIQNILDKLAIKTPEPGMVIYSRDWNGKKRIVGSTVQAWNPTVATLPDLTVMLSKTFINEVEVRKVAVGQEVRIGLDAYPDKKLVGRVTDVANMGEQRPNSDAKVFEVKILLTSTDTSLRPAMTTSNNILAGRLKNVLYIPLEALHNQGDSLTYVFVKDGSTITRRQVLTAETNENDAVIKLGLAKTESVLLNMPAKAEEYAMTLLPAGSIPKKPKDEPLKAPGDKKDSAKGPDSTGVNPIVKKADSSAVSLVKK